MPPRSGDRRSTRDRLPAIRGPIARAIAFAAATAALACSPSEGEDPLASRDPSGASAPPALLPPDLTLEPNARLRFALADHAPGDRLRLDLVLGPDDPSGPRRVRIVTLAGDRIETDARVLEGAPPRYRVSIPVERLGRGLHLIELDGANDHPLDLRRFVLEIVDAPPAGG